MHAWQDMQTPCVATQISRILPTHCGGPTIKLQLAFTGTTASKRHVSSLLSSPAAPSSPPGPGGSPDPVVFSVYSDHSAIGFATSPAAIAATPAPLMSLLLVLPGCCLLLALTQMDRALCGLVGLLPAWNATAAKQNKRGLQEGAR